MERAIRTECEVGVGCKVARPVTGLLVREHQPLVAEEVRATHSAHVGEAGYKERPALLRVVALRSEPVIMERPHAVRELGVRPIVKVRLLEEVVALATHSECAEEAEYKPLIAIAGLEVILKGHVELAVERQGPVDANSTQHLVAVVEQAIHSAHGVAEGCNKLAVYVLQPVVELKVQLIKEPGLAAGEVVVEGRVGQSVGHLVEEEVPATHNAREEQVGYRHLDVLQG